MRHHNTFRKLGRDTAHRAALLRNLATSLVINNRIETTLEKAKELKRVADKLVTLGKKNTLHARRQALQFLFVVNRTETGNAGKRLAMHKLFEEIAPRYTDRSGGYTRVVRTRKRDGDKAQMAVIEFVEGELQVKAAGKKVRKTRRAAVTTSDVVEAQVVTESTDSSTSEESKA